MFCRRVRSSNVSKGSSRRKRPLSYGLPILMKLRILYHGNCFDGAASAAIFSKFYKQQIDPQADIYYTPTMHRAGNAFDRDQFDGDENAIVDFKYCPDERLTWWFDHHQSAFL